MRRFSLTMFALCVLPTFGWTQDNKPTAEAVLDRYVEATGGKAAYEKIKNRVTTGTMEIKGAGVKGSMKSYEAPEANNRTVLEIGALGKIESGTDGKIAWEKSVVNGNRLYSGDEKAHALRNAYFNGDVNWRKVFKEAKLIGPKRVGDRECWQVDLTTPEGLVFQKCFDQKTGLLAMVKVTLKTPQMEMPTEIYPADYQKVDGLLLPFEMKMKLMSQELVMRADKIEHNVELPADTFKLPKEIQELVDKK